MKILVLAPDVPATSRMPGSPRLFNLCRELSRRHELVLLTQRSSESRLQEFLSDPTTRPVFKRIEVLPDLPPLGWWGQQWHRAHLAANIETRYRFRAHYDAIRARVRRVCADEQVDLIHADLLAMSQYVDPTIGLPAIVDLHDSMTLLARRMLEAERGWRRRLSAYVALIAARRLERALSRTFNLIITNSTVDEQVVRTVSPDARTLTITNGVDMEYFAPSAPPPVADKIVFTGVIAYGPNDDAARYFVEQIFPLVRARRPNAEIWIVGSDPADHIKALARTPGVHVTGVVDDVRPYVHSAAVFVSPLRIGAGVKNKVLAAMAMRKAIVATTLSVEGLNVSDNQEVLLADDPAVFAEKVTRLLADEAEAQRLGANGFATAHAQYSWAAMGKALEAAVERVMREARGGGRGDRLPSAVPHAEAAHTPSDERTRASR